MRRWDPGRVRVVMLAMSFSCVSLTPARAEEPKGDYAERLAKVTFERYVEAPSYSEGPTWRNSEVLFCSGALKRVDRDRRLHKLLEIKPAGTVLLGNGHLLICDNRHLALLDLAPDGKVGIVAERFEIEGLRSLNDLTVDAPRQRLLERPGWV